MTTAAPKFRQGIMVPKPGLVLKGPFTKFLAEGTDFPARFDVTFKDAGKPREPDGFFHPSTHPLWDEEYLVNYLAYPETVEHEALGFMGRFSVTVGTAMHSWVELVLQQIGLLTVPTGTCVCCKRTHGTAEGECDEWGIYDERTRTRGHLDGIINMPDGTQAGFDLKTSNNMKLSSKTDMDLDEFMDNWPGYYAQAQEYMRVSGLPKFVFLFLGMGHPWTMVEYHVPADPEFHALVEAKYLRVIEAARVAPDTAFR